MIEYENTDINIIKKGMPVFSHTIASGKKNIIEALSSALEINPSQANNLLNEISLIIPGMETNIDPQLNKTSSAVRGIFNNISNEIQKTIEFFASQNDETVEISKIILGGTGICINNIDKYLNNRLKIETLICDPFVNFKKDLVIQNVPSFTVAVGLALKGFKN